MFGSLKNMKNFIKHIYDLRLNLMMFVAAWMSLNEYVIVGEYISSVIIYIYFFGDEAWPLL